MMTRGEVKPRGKIVHLQETRDQGKKVKTSQSELDNK